MKNAQIPLNNPELVTVGDCLLAMQMGYVVEVNNGQVTAIKKDRKWW